MGKIILASGSRYRKQLIEKIGISVISIAPEVDETPYPGERAPELAARLSESKAQSLQHRHPNSLIIGSDQVAELDGALMGKPGNHDNAKEQLERCSGRVVRFYTGLSLLDSSTQKLQTRVHLTKVTFRPLNSRQIDRYLQLETPYDCAGSFKSEGLGICLFTKLESDDPNALVGLPLIFLVDMLGEAGIELPV